MKLTCQVCKKPMEGYSNKKTCGSVCKKTLLTQSKLRKLNDEMCLLIA